MGMKYRISESTLRRAVRNALHESPQDKWTLNESFIQAFFDALANSLGGLRQQYDNQQKMDAEAKMSVRYKDLISAVTDSLRAKGINQQYGQPGYVGDGFVRYGWTEENVNNIILEVLSSRLNSTIMNTVAQIDRVSQLPAIPGLSSKEGGAPAGAKDKTPEEQKAALDTAMKEHAQVVKDATAVVIKTLGDLVTILEGDRQIHTSLEQLVAQAGFGSTSIDFLHKMSHFDEILKAGGYGRKFNQRLSDIIMPISQKIGDAARRGLSKHSQQGNYKQGIAFNALPSDALKGAAQQKGETPKAAEPAPAKK